MKKFNSQKEDFLLKQCKCNIRSTEVDASFLPCSPHLLVRSRTKPKARAVLIRAALLSPGATVHHKTLHHEGESAHSGNKAQKSKIPFLLRSARIELQVFILTIQYQGKIKAIIRLREQKAYCLKKDNPFLNLILMFKPISCLKGIHDRAIMILLCADSNHFQNVQRMSCSDV